MEYMELWMKYEEIKDRLGAEELLEALSQSLSTDLLEDHLRYIDRTHDLDVF